MIGFPCKLADPFKVARSGNISFYVFPGSEQHIVVKRRRNFCGTQLLLSRSTIC
jgi:hypothetical protein